MEGIKNSIENIIKSESEKSLEEKGRKARKFILENKNKEAQGMRIINFVKFILSKEEKKKKWIRKKKF